MFGGYTKVRKFDLHIKYGYNYKALRITRDVLGVFKKEISNVSPLPFCFVKDTVLAEPYNGIVIPVSGGAAVTVTQLLSWRVAAAAYVTQDEKRDCEDIAESSTAFLRLLPASSLGA